MLFSEPKILNLLCEPVGAGPTVRFSALQRAENSQSRNGCRLSTLAKRFQCSSASRKFSISRTASAHQHHAGFSALQRAENSQCRDGRLLYRGCLTEFQCSSASRKFSIRNRVTVRVRSIPVSVLFSEPKILNGVSARTDERSRLVSVLFSEPKIPQC